MKNNAESEMAQNLSALVVEDDEQTLKALSFLLTHGMAIQEVREARDAEEALEVLRQEGFAVILCDYLLGGMDGVQFLEQLRSEGNTTPFILISGVPEKTWILRALRHANVGVLGKPFRVSDLGGTLDQLLAA